MAGEFKTMKLKLKAEGADAAEDQKPTTAPEFKGDGIFVRCCSVGPDVRCASVHPKTIVRGTRRLAASV